MARWIGAALSVLAMAAALSLRADGEAVLDYEASCRAAGSGAYDGYVYNRSADLYRVDGMTTFTFSKDPGYRTSIQVPANTLVPAGRTVLVARTQGPFAPVPGAYCTFDVSAAIRKQP